MKKSPPLTKGRARRAMKIGGLASQLGSSYLWNSVRRPFLAAERREKELLATHVKNARRIVASAVELRGAFLKLIQMLSMRTDLLPEEAIALLKTTRSEVPPMDYATISEQIRSELGRPPEALYASFETQAFAAASLGQVHRARLKNGREVAVKVQYPGVADAVEQDLQNLKLLLGAFERLAADVMRQRIETRTVYRELEARLKEELDYEGEARNMAEFTRLLSDDPEIMIPRAVGELSSRRVLTMTYLDGYQLSDLMGPGTDLELKRWIARKYYVLVWRQILEFGVLHTDPNPGNYVVTYHPRLGILDFGSIRHFPQAIRRSSRKLARALLDNDDNAIAQAVTSLGYLEHGQDPRPMVKIVRILFEPLFYDRPYDPADYHAVEKAAQVSEIAFEHKLYKSPPHAVLLVRALVGLDGIMKGLGVSQNYRALFRECLERAGA